MAVCGGLCYAQEARVIATVNGAKISSADITKRLWWQHSAQALSDLVDEKLLLDEAAALKVAIDQKEADQRFETIAAGYKDRKEFEKNLKSVGWTEKDVKDLIKKQLQIKAAVIAAKKIAFTDADATTFFEQNKDRLGKPESAKIRQIFVASKSDADGAYQALQAGADFAKLSALQSTDENLKKAEGDLGYIAKGLLQPEIEKEIYALKAGEYTKPIATGNGFSIFKLEDKKAGEAAVLNDKLKADIKVALVNQAVAQKLPELINELRAKAKIELAK
jgi:parvulin-like peptidyl-prolyl isomerase